MLFHPDRPGAKTAAIRAGESAGDFIELPVFCELREHRITGKNLRADIMQELIRLRRIHSQRVRETGTCRHVAVKQVNSG